MIHRFSRGVEKLHPPQFPFFSCHFLSNQTEQNNAAEVSGKPKKKKKALATKTSQGNE